MSDTSPLPLDPTDPRHRPVRPPRDAQHRGASADVPPAPPVRPRRHLPLVPTHDPYAAYGVRDEDDDLRAEDLVDPDELVTLRRRRVHRPTSDDDYRLSYAGTTGLVVALALGVAVLLVLLVWVRG